MSLLHKVKLDSQDSVNSSAANLSTPAADKQRMIKVKI